MAPEQKRSGFRFPWGGDRHEAEEAEVASSGTASIGTVLVEHRSRPAPMAIPGRRHEPEDPDDIGPGPFDVTADDDLTTDPGDLAEEGARAEELRAEELEAAEALAEEEAVREAMNWPQTDLSLKRGGTTAVTDAASDPAPDADAEPAAAADAEVEAAAVAEAEAAAEAEDDAVDEAVAEAADADAAEDTTTAEAAETDEAVAQVPEAPAPPPIVVEPGPEASAPRPMREPRKDNPLVANLVRAMRDAAGAARDETVAKVRADATTRLDEIRGRSTTRSMQMRKRSEEDVSAIKDWAKTEIARIRAEADDRIVGRKARLAREVEAHAEETERRLAEVDAVVAAFEAEMHGFFTSLMEESDPTHLAALAERMPEPPVYPDLPEIVDEPAWTPPSAGARGTSTRGSDRDGRGSRGARGRQAADPDGDDAAGEADEDDGEDDPSSRRGRRSRRRSGTDDDLAPLDVSETDLEDAEDGSAATAGGHGDGSAELPADVAAILSDEETLAALSGLASIEAMSRTAAEAAVRAEVDAAEAAESAKRAEEEAADAAEAARRAEAAGRQEPLPGAAASDEGETDDVPFGVAIESQTRVLVSGLGSIAAISAFKVALGSLTGVTSVNVTAAVDGEFVYSVTHAEYVDLRPVLTQLPGFAVTLRSDEGGILRVEAVESAA